MTEPLFTEPTPRLFALPPGADFAHAFARGLRERLKAQKPHAMTQIRVIVPTARMRLALTQAFAAMGPMYLPRIKTFSELAAEASSDLGTETKAAELARILRLASLVRALLRAEPRLGPPTAALGLAKTLAALAAEMAEEDVSAEALAALDVADHAEHWQRQQRFLELIGPYLAADAGPSGRLRAGLAALCAAWSREPPQDPVLVVGSTGSRRPSAELMRTVATLPQGAVVLPGAEVDMPEEARAALDLQGSDDHPQARLHRLRRSLGDPPLRLWVSNAEPDPARNRLIALALRPAPVTDGWRVEGAAISPEALAQVTFLDAPDPRTEALAIARAMAEARAEGKSVALVTPDRALARRVTAALEHYRLIPDDTAGIPLRQTPPARFVRLISKVMAHDRGVLSLIALLKNPFARLLHDRGQHLLFLRDLELWLRRKGVAALNPHVLANFAQAHPKAAAWVQALARWLAALPDLNEAATIPLEKAAQRLREAAEALSAPASAAGMTALDALDFFVRTEFGPPARAEPALPEARARAAATWGEMDASAKAEAGPGPVSDARDEPELWAGEAGGAVKEALLALASGAREALGLSLADLPAALELALEGELREAVLSDPLVQIWGTQEVRGRRAQCLILGGLIEGAWPEPPPPDPWLNRSLRQQAGLRLPEREIGLAAHDFQIAAGAPEVIFSRALRTTDAEAVQSRWLRRLELLAQGLPQLTAGFNAAKARGQALIERALAAARDFSAVPPECARRNPRPAPAPPIDLRPKTFRVSEIAELIRNPYALYARRVLQIEPLNPLAAETDARARGAAIHDALAKLWAEILGGQKLTPELFSTRLAEALATALPSPAERVLWQARIERIAEAFVAWQESLTGVPIVVEEGRTLTLAGFTLTGRPDRIDRLADGRLELWDFKTGQLPSQKEQRAFDKQLILLSLMAEKGCFTAGNRAAVARACFVRVGARFDLSPAPVDPETLAEHERRLVALLKSYNNPNQGYVARRAMQKDTDRSDYDGLSRLGEWLVTDPAVTLPLARARFLRIRGEPPEARPLPPGAEACLDREGDDAR